MAAIPTGLDLAWFTVAASCLVAFLTFEIRKRQERGRGSRTVGVFLSLVILFPCVSATDDLLGLALLLPRTDRQDETTILTTSDLQEGVDFELGVRLLALDHFQGVPVAPAPAPLHFPVQAPTATPAFAGHTPHLQAGRAPPSLNLSR